MTTPTTMKAVAEGYAPSAFYLIQSHESYGTRLVAYTPDIEVLKTAVSQIIDGFPDTVQILLKHLKTREGRQLKWRRFGGDCGKARLLSCLHLHEPFVFGDGMHVLCVRDAASGDYIALDEHDVLFCYGNVERCRTILSAIGFADRQEKLIYDGGHWHRSPPKAEELEAAFIRDLALSQLNED